jgi:asparagine synthase (glutamine-hydrolysing)
MSILFGICQAEGHAVEEPQLKALAQATLRYAVDGTFTRTEGRIGMGFQPYHTHLRSKLESEPAIDKRGNLLTLDGRIDNYREICQLLGIPNDEIPDSQIVLAAFERWGAGCFSRIVGDWALALWSRQDRSLFLARDHAGARTLYFKESNGNIIWSTCMETFFVDSPERNVDEVYAACYLSGQQTYDRTPYREIGVVQPAHYFVFHDGGLACTAYWQHTVTDTIRHLADADYEEHFLSLFGQAVQRRIGPGAPILAHLSGGMDSSSIVCMADQLCNKGKTEMAQFVDTVSYLDDTEPSWNERPFVTVVESARGKTGIHIENSFSDFLFEPSDPEDGQNLLPGKDRASQKREEHFELLTNSRSYRVILSGIGGDELLGGVPTALPELADYLVAGHFHELVQKGIAWGLATRIPVWHLLSETAMYTISLYSQPNRIARKQPPWLTPYLRRLSDDHVSHHPPLSRGFRFAPSALSNAAAWASILNTLAQIVPAHQVQREYRYPYLDRDLVDFLLRIPREQLVRPGRRRFLMRNALKGIVPAEILERRRKAVIIRGPLIVLQTARLRIKRLFAESALVEMHLLNRGAFLSAIDAAATDGALVWMADIARTILLELWLQASNRPQTRNDFEFSRTSPARVLPG